MGTTIVVMRIAAVFLAIFSVLVFSINPVFAKSPSPSASPSATLDPGKLEVGDALISPASSLYFLKALRERIEMMFSNDNEVKAHRQLEFSVRRLREVKSLIEENRQDLIEETLERYKDEIKQLSSLSFRDDKLKETLGASVARHLYVLQTLYLQVNEKGAKRAVRATIQELMDFNKKLLSEMEDKTLKNALMEKTALRQAAACQFLAGEVTSADLNEPEKQILKEYVDMCQKDSLKSGTIPSK